VMIVVSLKMSSEDSSKKLTKQGDDSKRRMNLSGTINTFRLLYAPRLARSHVVLNQFSELTFPLGKCIAQNVKKNYGIDVPEPDIRAIVIDKDNCIARPHALEVWPAYKV
jgi:phosphatidylglycerophosphatase GEP4